MTSELRAVFLLLMAVVLGGVGTLYALYKSASDKVVTCEISIAKQNSAIEALAQSSQVAIKAQKQRDKIAQAAANADAQRISEDMDADVPNDCADAMHWMVLESQNMRPK